jgi:CheY-like chemotaxis protein
MPLTGQPSGGRQTVVHERDQIGMQDWRSRRGAAETKAKDLRGPERELVGRTYDDTGGIKRSRSIMLSDPPLRSAVDVLVVDDDADIRSSFAEILRISGFSVDVAGDGDVALDLIGQLDVGVVLLDLRMPRRDGFAVLDALDAPPPVVLISAYPLDADVRARVRSKVVNYLQKPVSPRHLLPVVAGIVWNR